MTGWITLITAIAGLALEVVKLFKGDTNDGSEAVKKKTAEILKTRREIEGLQKTANTREERDELLKKKIALLSS